MSSSSLAAGGMTPGNDATGSDGPVEGPGGAPVMRPVVDLDSGSVLAVEVESPVSAPADDPAAQAELLARLARRMTTLESLLPLVLPLPATAVAGADPELFRLLERGLRRAGRRPRDVTLMLGPDMDGLPRRELVRGITRARGLGFRCALGTSSIAPDLFLDADPFLVRLDPRLTAGIPGDDRRTAMVEGLARIAQGTGAFLLATGVDSVHQLLRLREIGIRLAHGPLFADDRWNPGDRIRPIPDTAVASAASAAPGDSGPSIAEFVLPPVAMANDATAEDVLDAFTNDTALTSVVLIDHAERPIALLDRTRFLLAITGPYGHALHAKRPAYRLADPPRTVPRGFRAMEALRAAGADRERVYDDLVTVNEFGQCTGVVHVGDLIRSLAQN
ncbi:EAL domain-containing protein [Nocardiopsis mangrovi]|uniref:EAL domain-containing protein n=1 Tax=Nocardiopsis mangrovi TaxID=1179818 RepID=A0ABV9DXT8_9ACTN